MAPFIATLGMLYVARGFALLINDGATFPNLVGKEELNNTGFQLIGSGTFLSFRSKTSLLEEFISIPF